MPTTHRPEQAPWRPGPSNKTEAESLELAVLIMEQAHDDERCLAHCVPCVEFREEEWEGLFLPYKEPA